MSIANNIHAKFELLKADLLEFKKEFKAFAAHVEVELKEFKAFAVKTESRFDTLYGHVDGLAGEFKKFDEEQTILSGRQSDHSDRLEKLETQVFSHIS